MVLFAEEVGLVGRQSIDHLQSLFTISIVFIQVLVVLNEGCQIAGPQAFGQPRFDQLLLAFAKRYPGFLIDQLTKETEFFFRECDCRVIGHGERGFRGETKV